LHKHLIQRLITLHIEVLDCRIGIANKGVVNHGESGVMAIFIATAKNRSAKELITS
jgi:hypothetical protein